MTFEIDPQVGAALAAMSDGEALRRHRQRADVHARRLVLNADRRPGKFAVLVGAPPLNHR
jgi:hypothetical protein